MIGKPRLLFLAPITPALGGNGLAMRSGAMVEALSSFYAVDLLIIPMAQTVGQPLAPEISRTCSSVRYLPLNRWSNPCVRLMSYRFVPDYLRRRYPLPSEWQYISSGSTQRAVRLFPGVRWDALFVYRLYLVEFAHAFIESTGRSAGAYLDLDDIESETRASLADLMQGAGRRSEAALLRREAIQYRLLEEQWIPRFQRTFVCSPHDADLLGQRGFARQAVLPNVVRLPVPVGPPPNQTPFVFLFVGNLNYFPNLEGVLFFCREVAPRLHARAPLPLEIRIVGGGQPPHAGLLPPDTKWLGPVADLAPCYQQAHAVVVPIRAAGGTRIKALEAFSYRRPVVGTSIGLKGLNLQNETHALIGDTADEFARQCLRLMQDQALARSVGEKGYDLVTRQYTLSNLRDQLGAAGLFPKGQ